MQQDSPQYCHRGVAVEYVNLWWDNNLKVTYLFQHHIRPQRESPSSLPRKAIARSSNVREVDGASRRLTLRRARAGLDQGCPLPPDFAHCAAILVL